MGTIHDFLDGAGAAGKPSHARAPASSRTLTPFQLAMVPIGFGVAVLGVIAVSRTLHARRVEEQAAANEWELLDLLDDLRFELALRRRGIEP